MDALREHIRKLDLPGSKDIWDYKLPVDNAQFIKGLKEGWLVYDPATHKLVMGNPTDRLGLPIECPLDYNNKRLTVELRGAQTASYQRGDILWMATPHHWACFDVTHVADLYNSYRCFTKV